MWAEGEEKEGERTWSMRDNAGRMEGETRYDLNERKTKMSMTLNLEFGLARECEGGRASQIRWEVTAW